jgi:iron(II)-dependent oxidoreductase
MPAQQEQWQALEETRARTLELVEGLDEAALQRVITPLLSPLVWDLGHIANFEHRWLLGAQTELDGIYNPFENPRDTRGDLPLMDPDECFGYMRAVREQVAQRITECEPFNLELVISHEQQHNETMLQLLRIIPDHVPVWRRPCAPSGDKVSGSDDASYWIELPEGDHEFGTTPAGPEVFAYDNECLAHDRRIEPALIGRRPVTNAEYTEWVEGGGYGSDRWWSAEGLAWRDENAVQAPLAWERDCDGSWFERNGGVRERLRAGAPVVHICWFEAEAFARAHGARLPTEFEWEVAATHDPGADRRLNPWGDKAWEPGRAVLDQRSFGTTEETPHERVAGASPLGCEQMLGQVWEWTTSEFAAYPGFTPFRYREYSKPFFDGRFRVLRGGSWATRPRTVNARFRNWDFPQRRQLFAGFRLARDV